MRIVNSRQTILRPPTSLGTDRASLPSEKGKGDQVSLSGSSSFDLQALKDKTRPEALRLAKSMAPHRPRQVIVKLASEDQFSQTETENFFSDFNFASGRELNMSNEMSQSIGGRFYLAELRKDITVAEAIAALREDQRCLCAEPNHLVYRDEIVIDSERTEGENDEMAPPPDAPIDLRPTQWNLHNAGQTGGVVDADVDAPEAWKVSKGDGVVIALMDTGVDLTNEDLIPNLWVNPGEIPNDGIDNDGNGYIDDVHGVNLLETEKPPQDDNGHGTYNAAAIAAVEGNDSEGLVGLAPESKIMSIKFMEASGRGDIASAIEGISYAEAQGARMILNGWMTRTQNQSLFEVIEASEALHICSAGNDGYDNDLRPAHPASFPLPNVVAVAATDHHDDFTSFTNRGATSVDLAAPGRKIPVYQQSGKLVRQGGASIAAAHVAGAGALIVSRFPDVTNAQLATRLIHNGDPLPEDADRVASGKRLNAAAALKEDTIHPAAPGEFSVTAEDGSNLEFDFVAVSDNGGVNREPVAFYEARISSRPIVADDQVTTGTIGFSDATAIQLELPRDLMPGEKVTTKYGIGPSGLERHFHLAIRATDKVGNPSEISQADVVVPRTEVLFEEGFELYEGDTDIWTLEGDWKREPMAGRGSIVTDSPDGDYKNDVNESVVSPKIDLSNVTNAKLNFDARYTIEPKHDACFVEVETDGWFGKKWKKLARLDGFSDWKNHELDLTPYVGDEVRIRFRMDTDRDRVAYGIQLDHLSVSTRTPKESPQDS